MPTTVTFENAILQDAVNKAARLAPGKGAAFDKAAGIVFIVDPSLRTCTVRVTDLEVAYEQNIALSDGKGSPAVWRIPSNVLAGIITTLPVGEGATTDFIDRDGDGAIRLKSGRMISKLNIYPNTVDYPDQIFKFTTADLIPAQDLAYRVDQVSWAVDQKSAVLSGVHIDGEYLYGCNQKVLAVAPANINVDKPITVPLSSLSVLVKQASDCRVAAADERFFAQLDPESRASSTLIKGQYPNVRGLIRDDYAGRLSVNRQQFLDTLARIMVLTKTDKVPQMRVEINTQNLVPTMTFDMEIPDVGRMMDSIDVSVDPSKEGETPFDGLWEAWFAPNLIKDAVDHAKGDSFQFFFGHPDPAKTSMMPCRVADSRDYNCYVSLVRRNK